MAEMRLQKFLAMHGIASRRHCELLIVEGKVEVNGKPVTQLGSKVDPDQDEVVVLGEKVKVDRRFYVALYKPVGVVCTTNDPAGRPRAIDLVSNVPARLFPIGRLDEDNEGLLLLTNDGDLAQRVAHPSFAVPKVYRVVVKGTPDAAALDKIREGLWLAEGKTAPAHVKILRQTREFTSFTITLREGKNRELQRMFARLALPVTRLLRVQVGPVKLGSLKRGEWRMLATWEVAALRNGGSPEQAGPGPVRRGRGQRGGRGHQRLRGKRTLPPKHSNRPPPHLRPGSTRRRAAGR